MIMIIGRIQDTSGKIVGYKILEVETGLTKITSVSGVINNIHIIDNAELSKSGNLTGINGGLNRYATLDRNGNLLSKDKLVIIGKIPNGYKCTSSLGKVTDITEAVAIEFAARYGIANGKLEDNSIKPFSGHTYHEMYKSTQINSEPTEEPKKPERQEKPEIDNREFRPSRRVKDHYIFTPEERVRLKGLADECNKQLNYQQLQAATTLKGNIRLVAGAGTGKTNTLTKRIANLVASGVNPERILSVTFTNKAAAEMRERSASLLGISQRYLRLQTFHSLCNDILRQSIHVIGWKSSFTLGGISAFKEMLSDLMSNDPDIKNIPNAELTYIRKKILDYNNSVRKKEDYSYTEYLVDKELPQISRLKDLIQYEGNRDKMIEFGSWDYENDKNSPTFTYVCHIFAYQRRIAYLSFDDIIALTVLIFKTHPEVLEYWQNRFDYIQVDEFQDTSPLQFELIRMLSQKSGNLFVVGDPDQSIYKFRNAAPEILIGLNKKLTNLTDIVMDINYRSTKEVLDVGNTVIKLSDNRIPKDLRPASDSQRGDVPRILYDNLGEKLADKIVRNIQIELKNGTKPSQIAVLYRSKMSESLKNVVQLLTLNKIKFKVWGNAKLQRQAEYEFICDLFNSLLNRDNPYHIIAMLRHVRGMRITKKTKENFKNSTDCIQTYKDMYKAHKFSVESYNSLNSITEIIELIERLMGTNGDGDLSELIKYESNLPKLIKTVFTEDSAEFAEEIMKQLSNYKIEAEESGDQFNLAYVVSSLALIEDDESDNEEEAIQIMTIHKSKGLEFDCVFVLNININAFPSRQSVGDSLEEEVRLAYVAYTRAKKKLYLTCNSSQNWYGGGPSILVTGIPTSLISMSRTTEMQWSSFKQSALAEYYRAKGN